MKMPSVVGRLPVISALRDGAQTAWFAKARSNSTPPAASRSIFGDFTRVSPQQPSKGLRSSTQMSRTLSRPADGAL